jgi:nitrate reductase NapE component
MHLDPITAQTFIGGYSRILSMVQFIAGLVRSFIPSPWDA